MKKTAAKIFMSLLLTTTLTGIVGQVVADYVVKDNAGEVGVKIEIEKPVEPTIYKVTFNYPSVDDDGTFTSIDKDLEENSIILDNVPNTNDIGDYKFKDWWLDKDYTEAVTDETAVTSETNLYARYTCKNTLHYWDGTKQVYLTQSESDVDIEAPSVEYGERILGFTKHNGENIDDDFISTLTSIGIHSNSGIYKLTKNESDWKVERKFTVDVNDVSWWINDGAKSSLHFWQNDLPEIDYQLSFTSGNLSNDLYIDATYDNFVLGRIDPNNNDWWNQTVDVKFSDNGYSSTATKLKVLSSKTGKNQNINWTN